MLDLKKLQEKLDAALASETPESLKEWISREIAQEKAIYYKYRIGQDVYYCEKTYKESYIECPFCLGTGRSPECKGDKEIEKPIDFHYEVCKNKINFIRIEIDEDGAEIIYSIDYKSGWADEIDIFFTLEEAEKECKRLNE
jgi:hypothetical protein